MRYLMFVAWFAAMMHLANADGEELTIRAPSRDKIERIEQLLPPYDPATRTEANLLRAVLNRTRDRRRSLTEESMQLRDQLDGSRQLTDAQAAWCRDAVAAHNGRVQRLKEELDEFEGWARELTGDGQAGGSRLVQSKEKMIEIACLLLDSGAYDRSPNRTYCNEFVRDYSRIAYRYANFRGDRAVDILNHVQANPNEWTPLHSAGTPVIEAELKNAQDWANQGYLVLVASPNHVCAIMPGGLFPSGRWGMRTPQIPQAGQRVFSPDGKTKGHLSDGFRPQDMATLAIYVRYPQPNVGQ